MCHTKEQKIQRLKSHLKKKGKSDHERKMELEALAEQRKQYFGEDVLQSICESEWVLKVFKREIMFRHFGVQCSQGMLKFHAERMKPPKAGTTRGYGYGPFPNEVAQKVMYGIAVGMDWLHTYDIVHRDMKAFNVLVSIHKNGNYSCFICDYEYNMEL